MNMLPIGKLLQYNAIDIGTPVGINAFQYISPNGINAEPVLEAKQFEFNSFERFNIPLTNHDGSIAIAICDSNVLRFLIHYIHEEVVIHTNTRKPNTMTHIGIEDKTNCRMIIANDVFHNTLCINRHVRSICV